MNMESTKQHRWARQRGTEQRQTPSPQALSIGSGLTLDDIRATLLNTSSQTEAGRRVTQPLRSAGAETAN